MKECSLHISSNKKSCANPLWPGQLEVWFLTWRSSASSRQLEQTRAAPRCTPDTPDRGSRHVSSRRPSPRRFSACSGQRCGVSEEDPPVHLSSVHFSRYRYGNFWFLCQNSAVVDAQSRPFIHSKIHSSASRCTFLLDVRCWGFEICLKLPFNACVEVLWAAGGGATVDWQEVRHNLPFHCRTEQKTFWSFYKCHVLPL